MKRTGSHAADWIAASLSIHDILEKQCPQKKGNKKKQHEEIEK